LPVLLPRILSLPRGAPPLFGHYRCDENDHLVIRFNDADLPDPP
jgi:hypothetical protein